MPPAPTDPHPPQVIRLRPVFSDDLEYLFQVQLDPEGCRMAAVNPRDREGFFAHWANVLKDPHIVPRVILERDAPVGSISCFRRDGLPMVGYWLAREHWGRGIASRALVLLLEEVTIRPLHARAARANLASIRVLEKSGFTVTEYRWAPASDRFPACEEAILKLE